MLNLPEVTLVAIDCVAHELTKEAIFETCDRISPAEVHIWSDRRLFPEIPWHKCRLRSLESVATVLWTHVPQVIQTSHILLIQWDGWVLNEHCWNPDWLDFDYIGAPWDWHPENRVGNGGFSLRSRRLLKFLAEHPKEFPIRNPEDDTLCRKYRAALELEGFRWAPESLARRFSFERTRNPQATFGFHGLFNWPQVLTPDDLNWRASLANPYVRGKPEWAELRNFVT